MSESAIAGLREQIYGTSTPRLLPSNAELTRATDNLGNIFPLKLSPPDSDPDAPRQPQDVFNISTQIAVKKKEGYVAPGDDHYHDWVMAVVTCAARVIEGPPQRTVLIEGPRAPTTQEALSALLKVTEYVFFMGHGNVGVTREGLQLPYGPEGGVVNYVALGAASRYAARVNEKYGEPMAPRSEAE